MMHEKLYTRTHEFARACGPRVNQWSISRLDDDIIRQSAARYHVELAYRMPWFVKNVTTLFPACLARDHRWHIQTTNRRRDTVIKAVFDRAYYHLPSIVLDPQSSRDRFSAMLEQRIAVLTTVFCDVLAERFEALPPPEQDRFLQSYPRRMRALMGTMIEGLRKKQQRVFARLVSAAASATTRDLWWPQTAWR